MTGDDDDYGDFSNHPTSLSSYRVNKEQDAAKWTARDILVETLKKIDSGELNPDILTIWYREETGVDEPYKIGGQVAYKPGSGTDVFTLLGLLDIAKSEMIG